MLCCLFKLVLLCSSGCFKSVKMIIPFKISVDFVFLLLFLSFIYVSFSLKRLVSIPELLSAIKLLCMRFQRELVNVVDDLRLDILLRMLKTPHFSAKMNSLKEVQIPFYILVLKVHAGVLPSCWRLCALIGHQTHWGKHSIQDCEECHWHRPTPGLACRKLCPLNSFGR